MQKKPWDEIGIERRMRGKKATCRGGHRETRRLRRKHLSKTGEVLSDTEGNEKGYSVVTADKKTDDRQTGFYL